MYLIFIVLAIVFTREMNTREKPTEQITFQEEVPEYRVAPTIYSDNIPAGEKFKMRIYLQDLIANSSKYFGLHSSVLHPWHWFLQ